MDAAATANPTPETANQASLIGSLVASTPQHLPWLDPAEDHPSGVTGAPTCRIRSGGACSHGGVGHHDALADIWIYVAESSCRGYSPLYDRICRAVAESDAVLDMVAEAPPEGHNPVLLLAAVHDLLLGGLDHPLAAVYAGESDADPGPLFVDLCRRQRDALLRFLSTRRVNTNEVGRSATLGPALTTVAARLGEPLAHLDVGCSAGLNLLCDRYLLDYGPAGTTGPGDAPVRIACKVAGGTPPIAPLLPPIVARVGLDRAPVDVNDDDQARWQLACVWPDTGRLPRTRLALEEARRTPLTLLRGDAVDGVGPAIAGLPAGAVAVVTTTQVVAYLPPAQRTGFRDALAAASRDRPVAWISAEVQGVVDVLPCAGAPADDQGVEASVLGLAVFRDGGVDGTVLGYVHPHGSWIDWRA
jgi:hypothetical protein